MTEPLQIRDRIKELRRVNGRDLIPNPRNWRRHPQAQRDALGGVLAEVGFADALLARETPDGLMLLDGHLRLETLPDADLPVLVLDVTEEEADKLLVTFDPLGAMATPDTDVLSDLLQGIAFADESVQRMLEGLNNGSYHPLLAARKSDEEDAADTDSEIEKAEDEDYEPFTKLGQVWSLGDHRLMCGDCTEPNDVDELMAGTKADAVWTDPPYAIYGSASGLESSIADDKMVRPMFETVLRISAKTVKILGHVYVCSDWRSWASWWEMAKRTSLQVKNCIIWDKTGGGTGSGVGRNYRNCFEMVVFLTKVEQKLHMLSSSRRGQIRQIGLPNLVRVKRVHIGHKEHNAEKPVELISYNVEASTDEGGIVVDWFVGSGSTIIAAEKLGRRCYAMEIEPRYVDVSIRRWENYTGKKAALL